MTALYELWDTDTGNLLGTYPTQREALALVSSAIDTYGPDYAESLLLGIEDPDGNPKFIARGADLARLALASQPAK